MEIVLGVSMAPTTVRTALVEGEDADGVSVEEASFEVAAQGGAPEQVIATILGTREGAAEAGHRLTSTGVTWTEPTEVGALRDALAFREIRGVMLVSPLLAAAALTQTVGLAMDYGSTALLFVEPESATLAVVDTADGSIVDLHRQAVRADWRSTEEVNQLAAMIAALDGLESRPDGVFVVGCGVDIMPIKPQLDATVSVPVSAPEEPDMALARGAALASANAPLFASSTAALAYAQDPGTGENVLAPDYLDVSANARLAEGALAYSALADEDDGERRPSRRPLLLAGSGLAAVLLVGFVTLAISLAADVGSTLGQRTGPHGSVVPTTELPVTPSTHGPAAAAPVPSAPSAAPPPSAPPPSVEPPPPPQTITAPTPVVQQVPQPVMTPAPVHRAPTRQVPAYTPPPAAEGPPPAAPAPPPPAAPTPPPPQLPPMVMYLHLPFVTVPIPINPPPPPPPAQPGP